MSTADNTRIYVVTDHDDGAEQLVRANTKAQALRTALAPRFTADVATQDDLVRLVSKGHPVLDSSADTQADDTQEQQA